MPGRGPQAIHLLDQVADRQKPLSRHHGGRRGGTGGAVLVTGRRPGHGEAPWFARRERGGESEEERKWRREERVFNRAVSGADGVGVQSLQRIDAAAWRAKTWLDVDLTSNRFEVRIETVRTLPPAIQRCALWMARVQEEDATTTCWVVPLALAEAWVVVVVVVFLPHSAPLFVRPLVPSTAQASHDCALD